MANQDKQPTNFADCYVLSSKRTKNFIHSFLQTFLPEAAAYTNSYQVPESAEEPSHVFSSAEELIDYLEFHPEEPHAIYWYNKKETTVRGAMCLFMSDGHILFGLVTETLPGNTSFEESLLQQLKAFSGSSQGLILYEEPAPRTTKAFRERMSL